jgi:hypothetical protein
MIASVEGGLPNDHILTGGQKITLGDEGGGGGLDPLNKRAFLNGPLHSGLKAAMEAELYF